MPSSPPPLTDDEGTFLTLLVRVQPATAYQLSKIYAESPVSNFGISKGKIYPLIHRLKNRALIKATGVAGDARGTEKLECTSRGREAVRRWIKEMRPAHLLLEDPLRTKVQSFDLLTREERLEWISDAKAGLRRKLQELEDYAREVSVPYHGQVHDNAVSSIRCRIEWLDRLRKSVAASKRAK